MEETGTRFDYLVGTMIEVPRGAITAGEIAEVAEFFSFGTNDLTQTTLGVSRDDAGSFLPMYVDKEIYAKDPFEAIDQNGVGILMQWAVLQGRDVREKIKLGICGEHGGEPSSVEFCHSIGLDYVSCSPFRVPIARLAAARAAIRDLVEYQDIMREKKAKKAQKKQKAKDAKKDKKGKDSKKDKKKSKKK
jgi:pyruvate,orthophosphate dikinase